VRRFGLIALVLLVASSACAGLYPRNTEVPFAYIPGGERTWQLTDKPLAKGESLALGTPTDGLSIAFGRDGRMTVKAEAGLKKSFEIEIQFNGVGHSASSKIQLISAPPDRPITYLSDQLDDLIRIFRDSKTGQWRPVTRDAFDQYFRRLQGHGVRRLIVWPSAFPLINEPENYGAESWSLFEKQARAFLDDKELNEVLYSTPSYKPYQWHGMLMRFRLNREWSRMYAQSAADHDIALTVSYRPFEHALMKYYVIPVFDHEGRFLWNFLPGANPLVNSNPEKVAFAHYRQILKATGKDDHATLGSITLAAVPESKPRSITSKNLRVFAAKAPPIARSAFVMSQRKEGEFDVVRFGKIADRVEAQRVELKGWSLSAEDDGAIKLSGLRRPAGHRYIIVRRGEESNEQLALPVELPVVARSVAGSRIGRINAHWALADTIDENATSRLGPITKTGTYRTDFQAIENSFRLVRRSGKALRPLGGDEIVIDFGSDWSPEMMDYNRPASRRLAVAEIRAALAAPAFDEIVINTRSHTQLAGSQGDGELGVQTIAHHRRRRKNYFHNGIDRAYGPRSVAQSKSIQSLIQNGSDEAIEKITDWHAGEWQGTCQSESDGHHWRYARNAAVAKGVRSLLQDLEKEFPKTRIRVMIPPRAVVENSVKENLEDLPNPEGGTYDARYYRYLCSGNNQIPSIGEGMSMLDLSGLRAEPMFLGLRHLPDSRPLNLFVDSYLKNQSDNHGSSYQGAKSFFYEAQYTLRDKDKAASAKRREEIIRNLLVRREIDEVILYEAANWTYDLPLDNPHQYLER
tara:strand:+ start:1530 stop:3938 length:2409 start_codon:yes stop_codon:yes gene_type:complete